MALDTVTIPKIVVGNVSGPASYAAGGFELDLSASFAVLHFFKPVIETAGVLEAEEFEVGINQDTTGALSYGKVVIKIYRDRYDKFSIGAVSGLPAGTATQAAKFAAGTTTNSSHTHTIDHDHPATVSAAMTAAGGAVVSNAAGGAMELHTHSVNVPNFTGNSGANTHSHERSFEYEHSHSFTDAETDISLVEVAAATDLSGVTFRYIAAGYGDQ